MTGYADASGQFDSVDWMLEVRTVNNKGLDLRLRLPDGFAMTEARWRKKIAQVVRRGSVQLSLKVKTSVSENRPDIDPDQLAWWIAQLEKVDLVAADSQLRLASCSALDILLARPSVFSQNQSIDIAALQPALDQTLQEALTELVAMRRTEGDHLMVVLKANLADVSKLVGSARKTLALRAQDQQDNLWAALKRIGQDNVDPDRFQQEVALLAVKSDVSEELDRLEGHVAAAEELLESDTPAGRKLEFLMQEFNREANTLCSKALHQDLTRIGLDLKILIDQMREQVLNVE